MRRRAALAEQTRRVDLAAVAVWLLGFGLVAYLGLNGGGYDALVHDQVGILVWWIVLAGVAVGALPRCRPSVPAWAALGLLAAFVVWTALSLGWTESTARTSADLARVAGYLGIFALALLSRAAGDSSRLIGAVASGIVVVALVALLSRLHPSWFPEAAQTAEFIDDSRERLSYPLDYWNGLAAMIAIGVPLLLQCAAGARSLALRALAAAAIPALILAVFFTLSRGGIAAAALALAVYLALAADRLPKLLALVIAGGGSAILVLAASGRDALQDGLAGPVAQQQGDGLLAIAILVCAAVGLTHAAISYALHDERRPRWTRVPRRTAQVASVVGVLVLLVAALALGGPGRVSDGWDEFRRGDGPGSGTDRLDSVAGQSRYQLWQAAIDENGVRPLAGTGSGTFELWWARNGRTGESVRDTHSLYLQTLGELGIVGLALLLAFLVAIFGLGGRAMVRAGPPERSWLAAALAGCAAFCLTAVVDWMWQIPVLAVAMLLLASLLVTSGRRPGEASDRSLGLPARAGVVVAALVAIVAIAIPLATTAQLRQSEADARAGDLDGALEAARTAQNVQPGSAPARLQEALVLEARGEPARGAAAARAAIEREPANWRNWLVLSRLDAELGRAARSARDYAKARSLNPESPVFER